LRGDINAKNPKFETLSSVVRSQIKLHSKMGGVIPEVAARAHTEAIRPVVERALLEAKLETRNSKPETNLKTINYKLKTGIDLIAVTSGPGLIASLLIGVEFAKTLAFAANKKMIAVNHMEGHLYSAFGGEFQISNSQFLNKFKSQNSKVKIPNPQPATRNPQFPILSLIVSGGHTLLVLQKDEAHYKVLGSTVDDAAGEAFDKVAKLLGLPYPGGPEISRLAAKGDIDAAKKINFPRPMINSKDFDFSFSGLKTSVLYYLQNNHPYQKSNAFTPSPSLSSVALAKGDEERAGGEVVPKNKTTLHHFNFSHIPEQDKANIALAFEEAVVDVLITKAMRAIKKYGCKTISLSGGVAANKRLRSALQLATRNSQLNFIVPDFRLCTDNAEMIAIAAYFKLRSNYKPVNFSKIKANSGWELV
jgi:N6-L-threonylcarbamoyladenine synthase